jgi:hypothetical protein
MPPIAVGRARPGKMTACAAETGFPSSTGSQPLSAGIAFTSHQIMAVIQSPAGELRRWQDGPPLIIGHAPAWS